MEEQIIVMKTGSIREIIKEEIKNSLIEWANCFESMMINKDKIYTREETVKCLGISPSTLYRWTKEGRIKAFGIGDRVYYKHADIKGALVAIN